MKDLTDGQSRTLLASVISRLTIGPIVGPSPVFIPAVEPVSAESVLLYSKPLV